MKPETFVALLCGLLAFVAFSMLALSKPAHAKTKWPTVAELQRCEVPFDKMKDAKLRRWCEYWSRRLP